MKIMGGILWENKSYISARNPERAAKGGESIKCGICGETVTGIDREEYAYKRFTGRGRPIFFCSWHCLREYERQNPEYVRMDARKLASKACHNEWRYSRDGIEQRIKFCLSRFRMYSTRRQKADTIAHINQSNKSMREWREKLTEAQETLRKWDDEHGEK